MPESTKKLTIEELKQIIEKEAEEINPFGTGMQQVKADVLISHQ